MIKKKQKKQKKNNKAIDTMRLAGIDAQSDKKDTDNFIEYTIRIPKRHQEPDAEKTA